jgi:hypothetical protein
MKVTKTKRELKVLRESVLYFSLDRKINMLLKLRDCLKKLQM